MNGTIRIALLEDAWRQVLDNKVFRLLAVLVFIPIAATFVIGFHEDGIEILWGTWEVEYGDLMGFMGARGAAGVDAQTIAVQAFQSIVTGFIGGQLGVIFCVAATAFFMPRMMEKGAADTVFSKPVSRFALLLSRYAAGLIFVAVLAFALVLGMYVGLLLVSGYDDPGFLWGALTLVYVYAILHAFSIAVAVITRSSTAAILLSLVLFMFSGCIHRGWIVKEITDQQGLSEAIAEHAEEDEPPSKDELRRELEAERGAALRTLLTTLDVLHYTLPKTTEAGVITEKLKRAVDRYQLALFDREGDLRVRDDPPGFVLDPETVEDVTGAGVRWTSPAAGTPPDGEIRILRRVRRPPDGKRLNASRLVLDLMIELRARDDLAGEPEKSDRQAAGRLAPGANWAEPTETGTQLRARVFLNAGDWLYELDARLDAPPWEAERRDEVLDEFLADWAVGDEAVMDPDLWLIDQYGWDAELKFNLWFSIGSSVAFAALMLAIAGIRLQRIDF